MPLNKSWHEYNKSLIERRRILMDIGFLESSESELYRYITENHYQLHYQLSFAPPQDVLKHILS